jgi:hypothetical protein
MENSMSESEVGVVLSGTRNTATCPIEYSCKLTASWQSVVEDAALTTGQRLEKKLGQKQLI